VSHVRAQYQDHDNHLQTDGSREREMIVIGHVTVAHSLHESAEFVPRKTERSFSMKVIPVFYRLSMFKLKWFEK